MRSRTEAWANEETRRRSGLPPELRCPTVLMSFPRSGNHLVRWYLESTFGWSTLGAEDGEWHQAPAQLHDPPLHVRGLVSDPCSLHVVAVKRHSARDLEHFRVLVLVERDPVEAVLSDLRDCDDAEFASSAAIKVRHYRAVRQAYENWQGPRQLLQYEDIARDPSQLAELATWLRGKDPRLPDPRPVPASGSRGSIPTLTRRPPASPPGDPHFYRTTSPDRAALVERILMAEALPRS